MYRRDIIILAFSLICSVAISIVGLHTIEMRCSPQSWFGGFVALGMILLALGLILTSTKLIAKAPEKNIGNIGSLFCSICSLLVLVSALFSRGIRQDFTFKSNFRDYQEVIQLVENGEIQPNEYGQAMLPDSYWHLSDCGGEILIDAHDGVMRIFFFTYRDMFDDFGGYLYRSDDSEPQSDDFLNRRVRLRSWQGFRKVAPHWFHCSNA